MWNPSEHSDDENLRWCWLRAVEWGNWPLFISQPVVPVVFLFVPWKTVVATVVIINLVWALGIRYSVVIVVPAFWGALFVRLKWLACPISAWLLYREGSSRLAVLALLWPVAIMVIGIITPPQIGKIQRMFMDCIGYTRQEPSAVEN